MRESMIIDRFEGDFAVVEPKNENDDRHVDLPRDLLPADAREGDVIVLTNQKYEIDQAETQKRRSAAVALLKKLRSKS